ncbi:LacI family DNA-binding transcriptional regulator [Vreelandella populi]|uniref:LacI family transcriptional regulator n=1 Tax=Vreelandella populi TaxID=2498858 RepID=A0A3S0WPE2_9GAMM|nr:LacI family DNA-binding transcriptional regulator [Halomonas populi]RUR47780.1 LacI family transcriptional regulator [Halomonas populi]RUR54357.1 LacI family transcriptional regulator [Halomonas populi]
MFNTQVTGKHPHSVPTIKDVAKAAGCSTATVSRALATPEKVSDTTRERVNQAIAQVGYAPNIAARNLRRAESKTIVALLPDISNPFFSEIISGMEDVAHQAGYQILIGDCEHDPARAEAYFRLLSTNQADGIVLLTSEIPKALIKQADGQADFPLVMACEFFSDIDLPLIAIDNHQASCQAIDYLVSLGHQRIATLTGPAGNPICLERLRGYRDTLSAHGLIDQACVAEGDFGFRSGFQQGLALLDNAQRPTAIFCHSDEMAIGVLKAARQLNIAVPGQLSVVGFDNIGLSEYCDPELTTISQPRNEIGQQAMQSLLHLLRGERVIRRQTLSSHLIVRKSTGRVNA